ncbi:MAG: hypothetical protein JEZ04_08695 [Spirochaetales bacterium]|nr:hypothetical protein [Spirochaetales bacterium]
MMAITMMYTRIKETALIFAMLFIAAGSGFSEVPARLSYDAQWPDSIFPVEPFQGEVAGVEESAFYLSYDGGELRKELKYSLLLTYDGEGRLESEEYFNEDGSSANSIRYEYENGHIAFKIQNHPDIINPDREIFRISEDGRILEAEKIFSKGNYGWRYKNSFDNEGRIVLTSKYDRFWKWKLVYSRMFDYDEQGRLVSTEGFGMDYKLLWRDEHSYDDEGRLVESVKYNPDGGLVVKIVNSYNSRGFVTKREFFDNTGESYAIYTYGYNFDEKGNWTEKIIGREEAGKASKYLNPDSMVVRSIEYSD